LSLAMLLLRKHARRMQVPLLYHWQRSSFMRATAWLLSVVACLSCQGDNILRVIEPQCGYVVVSPSNLTLGAGETMRVTGVARDSTGAALLWKRVVWVSSVPHIAYVDDQGVLYGVSAGGTTVRPMCDKEPKSSTEWPVTVTTTPSVKPSLQLDVDTLKFEGVTGGGALSRTVFVSSGTALPIQIDSMYASYGDAATTAWLLTNASGVGTPVGVGVTASIVGMQPGIYRANLEMLGRASDGTAVSRIMPVVLTLAPSSPAFSQLGASPSAVTLTVLAAQSTTYKVSLVGSGGIVSSLLVNAVSYTTGAFGWLSAALDKSTTPATLTLLTSSAGLPAGFYTAAVVVHGVSNGLATSQTVNVGMSVIPLPVSPPQIGSIQPAPLTAKASAQTILVTGSSFAQGASVLIASPSLTTSLSGSQLTSTSSYITFPFVVSTPGVWVFQVVNPSGAASGKFSVLVGPNQVSYSINAAASPTSGGSASGSGTFTANSVVTLTANAASGYQFVNWTENGSQVATSPTYQFTATSNRALVANFAGLTAGQPIATSLNRPWDIASDGARIYWVENDAAQGAVRSVSVAGGTVLTLASGLASPCAIAVDGSFVYWIERNGGSNGSLKRLPLGGGSIVTLVTGLTNAQNHIALDASSAYFGDALSNGGGAIRKVPKSGGAVTTLVGDNTTLTTAVATDGQYVYFEDGRNNIKRVPVGGGAPTTIGFGRPSALVISSSNLYWVEYYTGAVKRLPLGGGSASTIAMGPIGASGLASDGLNVYWIVLDSPGAVSRVSVNGGVIATIGTEANTEGVTVVGGSVYWSASIAMNQGKILRAPK
jgi:hypothetical protein